MTGKARQSGAVWLWYIEDDEGKELESRFVRTQEEAIAEMQEAYTRLKTGGAK